MRTVLSHVESARKLPIENNGAVFNVYEQNTDT